MPEGGGIESCVSLKKKIVDGQLIDHDHSLHTRQSILFTGSHEGKGDVANRYMYFFIYKTESNS